MIPLVDLKAQYRSIESEITAAIGRVMESSQFILGPEVAAFEEEFAAYCGAQAAVAVSSGSSALHLALLAAGIGPGDEVITVPNTFVATAAAILYCGARPVFVDIDPATFNIDPARIEAAVTGRTRAIVPVHLYGQPADLDPILEIAGRHGLTVIEDAAQAHGADYKGRRIGGIGALTCFSFYPGKNLGAYGEGGAVTTSDPDLADRVRRLRDWGQDGKHNHVLRGYNFRMDGLQGAILRVKLAHLEDWTEARRHHAARYDALLAGSDCVTPAVRADVRHVYHVYEIRLAARDEVLARMSEAGIGCSVHYPTPIHLQPAYGDLGYRAGAFPLAEQAAKEILSLPIYPELSEPQAATVVAALKAAMGASLQAASA